MAEHSTNPLIEKLHERLIERPDTIYTWRHRSHSKIDWHPIAAGVATLASLLCQYQHRWNKGEKKLYRRALKAARHPCCPTCGSPMTEGTVTTLDGLCRKSWHCANCQNL